MTLGPQEIVRSEMEGGLSGPANSLTDESIDCGCGGYRLRRLAKFATRRIFLTLLCSIGVLQAAAQAYFHVTSSTVARKYHFDQNLTEWILCVPEITLVIFGLAIAYWGDKFHRASWLGALTLIQSVSFFVLIVPHCVNDTIEPENITHMSIYTEDSDLCMKMSSRLIGVEDSPHYSTLFILIIVQIVTGMANITYYALGISYLDDNTKRVHASVYIGIVLASKFFGRVLGYMLGWGFLRIDADNLLPIEFSTNQIGAWWFGWPIYALLLSIPGTLMSIFPRKLPSEMVQQAAETILDQSGTIRETQRIAFKKVGSTQFFSSMLRLLTNKIFTFNLLAASFCITALTNFIDNENIFLESRFYAPRPSGLLLGFEDPLVSRTITTVVKPILIGLTIIIAGLVIARAKPKIKTLVVYNFVVLLVSALIIFCLAFVNCHKATIVGTYKGSIQLIQYCNKDCECSRNADFRPVCDTSGTFTFYSPCYAGCSDMHFENNEKIYTNCSCVEENLGSGKVEARDGPCDSDNCQVGWIIYEILTMLVYSVAASTIIGDVLISLRSVNPQDKALSIGYIMSVLGFFAYVIGKISYDEVAKSTCNHWGLNDRVCHLHHPINLGNYLCFITSGLIIIGALFKIGVWFFSKDLEIYDSISLPSSQQLTEMKDMSKTQVEPLLQPRSTSTVQNTENDERREEAVNNTTEPVVVLENINNGNNRPISNIILHEEPYRSRLKYGPVGIGDKRTVKSQSNHSIVNTGTDDELDSSDSSRVLRKGSLSQVSYKPLEIDSDVESDLSGTAPRSRKRIPSTDLEESDKGIQENGLSPSKIRFPNPENYEDPRKSRTSRNNSPNLLVDTLSKIASTDLMKQEKNDTQLSTSKGDFNEVGIPVIESYEAIVKGSTTSLRSPTIMLSMQYLDKNPERELLEETGFIYKSTRKNDNEEVEENRNFRLEKLMQPIDYPANTTRPPSRDQGSSGFGSLQDLREKSKLHGDVSDSRDSLSSKSSVSGPPKKGSPLCTDL